MTTIGDDLRRTVRGRVLTPGDEGSETARLPWARSMNQRVRAVVEVEDATDAAAVIRSARLAGLSVAPQPSGHGASAELDGTILIHTARLRGLEIRPDERLARVEAGVQWGEVLAASSKHALAGLAASSPAVSATGYSLGGGLSWFSRRYGYAANRVRALDVVDAEGARNRVTADADADLFWALRGGGGDFALVTAIEFDLFPAPQLYGGRVLWPVARAEEVLSAFRDISAAAPQELTVWFVLLRFPPLPELPGPLRGRSAVAIDAAYLGDPAEGRALLHRLERIPDVILDTRAALPVDALGSVSTEPAEPGPALWRSEVLTRLDDAAATTLLSAAIESGTVDPLVRVEVRHLGGALRVRAENEGACGHLAEPYLLVMVGDVVSPEVGEAVKERHAAISRALTPYATGRKPFNYLGYGEKAASAFPCEVLARLRDIKRRRDPDGVFRSNHPVLA
ncbi:FAD-binding oxidoreductase [Nonomuraea sp. NPDC049152]|uniref:FAD-binding oxidoreductase n=1 Tax=Nonomuraea sp. NPDC049152 TaxID=3154350 RepID=UPI0033E90955